MSLIKIVVLIKSGVYGVSLSSWQSANMPYLPAWSSSIQKECVLLSPFINMETRLRKVKLLIIIRQWVGVRVWKQLAWCPEVLLLTVKRCGIHLLYWDAWGVFPWVVPVGNWAVMPTWFSSLLGIRSLWLLSSSLFCCQMIACREEITLVLPYKHGRTV